MYILLLLLGLFFLSSCNSDGYDRHYIVSDTLEETFSLPEDDRPE